MGWLITQTSFVSIPFKRESVSEREACKASGRFAKSFNSLQTGKRIWTSQMLEKHILYMLKFQFPSNGKAYLNQDVRLKVAKHV